MDAPKNLMLSLNQALEQAQVDPQLVSLIDSITTTCKNIAERLRGGALSGLYGSAEQENVQGEVQKKLTLFPTTYSNKYCWPIAALPALLPKKKKTPLQATLRAIT